MKKTTIFASVFIMCGAFALLAMQGFEIQYKSLDAGMVRGGACNESKSANDGSCREEKGCSAANTESGGCQLANPNDDPNDWDSPRVCSSSIAPEGNPGGSQVGYALLKNADGWKSACNHPESGTTTCSSTTIACAIEVKCLTECIPVATVFGQPLKFCCKSDQSANNYTERGKHSDYSASGVACPIP